MEKRLNYEVTSFREFFSHVVEFYCLQVTGIPCIRKIIQALYLTHFLQFTLHDLELFTS